MMTKDAVYPWTKNHEWNDEWVTKSVRRFPEWGKTFDRNNLMINQVRLLLVKFPPNWMILYSLLNPYRQKL